MDAEFAWQMACRATPCRAVLRHAVLRHAVLCHAVLRHAVLRHAVLRALRHGGTRSQATSKRPPPAGQEAECGHSPVVKRRPTKRDSAVAGATAHMQAPHSHGPTFSSTLPPPLPSLPPLPSPLPPSLPPSFTHSLPASHASSLPLLFTCSQASQECGQEVESRRVHEHYSVALLHSALHSQPDSDRARLRLQIRIRQLSLHVAV